MVKQSPEPRIIEIKPVADPNVKVHPRTVSGLFNNWRVAFVWLTQIVFYGLCWLPWNGRQAVLFDLDTRRFYLFDLVLWPQDTIYLTWLLLLSALALFLFTALAGRLWCGYSCPQTVYTEIFLWVERWIEGDRPQRIKLDKAPNSPEKLRKKTLKHAIWLLIALWTGITFVGYFTPIRDLIGGFASGGTGPWEIFWILFYGAATYGMAGFMREHMCKYICPYAQFQFVMFDRDTLIVAYDAQRGDPRGNRPKQADPRASGLGDCIDCGICVQVCPTGIDIRDGLQLECIGCAACIDACDQVMDKMKYPRGLIRYSTENAVEQGFGRSEIVRRTLRLRPMLYLGALLLIGGAGAWSLATRMPLKVGIEKERAALYRESDNGNIENAFRMHLTNASEQAREFRIEVAGLPGIRLDGGGPVSVPAAGMQEITLSVQAEAGSRAAGSHPIVFTVIDAADPEIRVDQKASFWLP
ncbi:cytochrome c oxidase accessory protein CcoG [Azonexus fungiphilus]|uniref:cytochrome c oxidase accessory protein CcoG n=1 Tax=Azonexus fungiphilus TaxID=146940 RepID=UPI00156AC16D|nr:cytochrome c oxidase accessory protein CcoG [Azonexus fungiphilus]NHC07867.1 cytochrome c oxidase accessory protein CcoG [Azonexus fungiphilus]